MAALRRNPLSGKGCGFNTTALPSRLLRGRTRCCGAEERAGRGGLTFSSRHSSGSRRSAASASHRLRSRIKFSSSRVAAMVAPELASAPGAILGRGAGRGGKRRAGRDRPGLFKNQKNFPQITPNPRRAHGHRGSCGSGQRWGGAELFPHSQHGAGREGPGHGRGLKALLWDGGSPSGVSLHRGEAARTAHPAWELLFAPGAQKSSPVTPQPR